MYSVELFSATELTVIHEDVFRLRYTGPIAIEMYLWVSMLVFYLIVFLFPALWTRFYWHFIVKFFCVVRAEDGHAMDKEYLQTRERFWYALESSLRSQENTIQEKLQLIYEFETNMDMAPLDCFDINAKSTRTEFLGYTPLCICLSKGNLADAAYMLSNGADVEATSDTCESSSMTPLLFSAQRMGTALLTNDVIHFLVSRGANVYAIDSAGKTVLHYICTNRNYCAGTILNALYRVYEHALDKKLLVLMKDSSGRTVFDYVFDRFQPNVPYTKIVDLLIDMGADVNSDKCFLHTAIHRMAQRSRYDGPYTTPTNYKAIKMLLMNGADPSKIYQTRSATAMALRLIPDRHPACDNVIAIFKMIKDLLEKRLQSGADAQLEITDVDDIIQAVETASRLSK